MNHTKEPWEAKADPSYYGIVSEICAMEKFIASLGGVCSPDEVEANARRIVACVNACAGITTEALESGLIKHLLNDAYMRTLNPFLPNPQRKQDMTYLGKPVYEKDFEEAGK